MNNYALRKGKRAGSSFTGSNISDVDGTAFYVDNMPSYDSAQIQQRPNEHWIIWRDSVGQWYGDFATEEDALAFLGQELDREETDFLTISNLETFQDGVPVGAVLTNVKADDPLAWWMINFDHAGDRHRCFLEKFKACTRPESVDNGGRP